MKINNLIARALLIVGLLIIHPSSVFALSVGDRVQCVTTGVKIRSSAGTSAQELATIPINDKGEIFLSVKSLESQRAG